MFGPSPTPCTGEYETDDVVGNQNQYEYWKDKKTVSLLVAIAALAIGLVASLVLR
jgi:hypothetical protein